MTTHPDWILDAVKKNHPRQVALPNNKVSLAEACGFVPLRKPGQPTFVESVNHYACVVASEKAEAAFVEGVLSELTGKTKGKTPVTLKFTSACAVKGQHYPAGTTATFPATIAAELLRARRAVEVVQPVSPKPLSAAEPKPTPSASFGARLLRRICGGIFRNKKL